MQIIKRLWRAGAAGKLTLGCGSLFLLLFACIALAALLPARQATPAELAARDATSIARQMTTINARNTAEVPPQMPESTPTLSHMDTLNRIAHDIFPRNLMSASFDGVTATIVFSTAAASDENAVVLLAAAGLRESAPRVFAETEAQWFVLDARAPFTDLTGAQVERSAIRVTLSRGLNHAIHWDNFNVGNFDAVAAIANDGSSVNVHPGIMRAWEAYRRDQ